MPELPEVEHLRRTLLGVLPGRTIVWSTLHRRDVCTSYAGPDCAQRRTRRADLLVGGRVADLLRHGKQLAVVTDDGRALCIHLGMSGQVLHTPANGASGRRAGSPRADHVHAAWRLDDGACLVFRDPRRFGGLWTFPSFHALCAARWASLGPDGLTVSGKDLAIGLHNTRRAIKAALLDQAVVAGVGNIYADEALFAGAISPLRPGCTLTGPELDQLAGCIRAVLDRSIAAGGSTLRDYVDAQGQAGRHQLAHAVYGRSGRPCVACGIALTQIQLAGRTTVFCTVCQDSSA